MRLSADEIVFSDIVAAVHRESHKQKPMRRGIVRDVESSVGGRTFPTFSTSVMALTLQPLDVTPYARPSLAVPA